MGKRSDRRKRAKAIAAKSAAKGSATASRKSPEKRIQSFLDQHRYEQAISLFRGLDDEKKKSLPFSEADLWGQQGRYECQNSLYEKAEVSLRKAIELDNSDSVDAVKDKTKKNHNVDDAPIYWLSKTLLNQDKEGEALELIETAFNEQRLDKNLGACYLKLLFINDQGDRVQAILDTPKLSKRFFAPQLHWARGILAIQSEKFGAKDGALTHFKKLKNSVTPGDNVSVWTAYTHQRAGNMAKATEMLISPFSRASIFASISAKPSHPAMERLAIAQAIATDVSIKDTVSMEEFSSNQKEAVLIFELTHLLEEDRAHDAANIFLDLPPSAINTYPEIAQLQKPLMLVAGSEAYRSREPDSTIEFWKSVLDIPAFDPKLALRLHKVLLEEDEDREIIALMPRLIEWVTQDCKQNPAMWPKDKLDAVLAKLNCRLMDAHMGMGQYKNMERILKNVTRLYPDNPEVIGRHGLEAVINGKEEKGIDLLRKALDGGCDYPTVYFMLIDHLDHEDDVYEVRAKYGKRFGDIAVEADKPSLPDWVDALLMNNYDLMERYLDEKRQRSPSLDAIKILFDSAKDEPSKTHKITLDSDAASAQWDKLLEKHPPETQVSILQAIVLVVQNHAKRNKKGIKALQDKYQVKLIELSETLPEAGIAQKALLVIRGGLSSERLMTTVKLTVERSLNPGKTLAAIQQKARWFKSGAVLRPYIDELLKKDSQNPQLLLAKATTYSDRSSEYATFHDQGFELARRLQDSDALQAFREEDAFLSQTATSRVFKGVGSLDLERMDPAQLLRRMIREMLGEDIPDSMIDAMLPGLIEKMEAEMGGGFGPPGFGPPGFGPPGFGPPGFGFDPFGDDDDDIDFFAFPPPSRTKKKKKKRKGRRF
ncbi:MAG: tetratricopeptide repeat protein [Cyanobacteria bacterium P01_F01_bin.150]